MPKDNVTLSSDHHVCNSVKNSPVSQLTEPGESLGIFHFLCYHLLYYISCMDINGTDGHDTLSITLCEVSKQQVDQGVQLAYLLLEVVFECCFKSFFHSTEGNIHLCCPPDLSASQCHLYFVKCGHECVYVCASK